MKLLSTLFVLFSFSAMTQERDLSETIWTFSSAGCRDSSLSTNSHVSKTPNSADVTAGIVNFEDSKNVRLNGKIEVKDEKTGKIKREEQTIRGTYSVSEDIVTFSGGRGKNMNGYFRIEDGSERLIIIGSSTESEVLCCNIHWVENWRQTKERIEAEGVETWDEHVKSKGWNKGWIAETREELETLKDDCLKENPFVYVLGKVTTN